MQTVAKAFGIAAIAICGGALIWWALASNALPNASGSDGDAAGKVKALFADWEHANAPGCSFGVSRRGAIVLEGAFGKANLETSAAIAPSSVFPAASLSKPFTAMAVLLLARQGRLSLDDEVRRHIPEWSAQQPVTIRQLLSHTGGLRDAFLLVELAAPRRDVSPNDALFQVLARQRGLNFQPGAEQEYNNGGYNLLGHLVKRVSRQPLAAFANEQIFQPLAMTKTHFRADPTFAAPDRVTSYSKVDGRWSPVCAECDGIVGNAGLFTTVSDLLRWDRNFGDVRVGDAEILSTMQMPATLSNGDPTRFGLGLEISEHRGFKTVGHAGGDRGVATRFVRYPEQGLGIGVLCNFDAIGASLDNLTRRMADLYLRENAEAPVQPVNTAGRQAPRLSPEQLEAKAGFYHAGGDASVENVTRIVARDDTLVASAGIGETFELVPDTPDRFSIQGTSIVLTLLPAGAKRSEQFQLFGAGSEPQIWRRVPPFTPSPVMLKALAGAYTSTELDTVYVVAVDAGGATIRIPGRAETRLEPVFDDAFRAAGLVDYVTFERDRGGAVTALVLHATGARSLRLDRRPATSSQ